ncbi:YqbF domain-containing protein [Bacillus cereus]|uniref:YqbF domain-containing protein n=1 Tax=Bacillus cereus TaxID=1396 RepID=UPI00398164F4
MYYATLIKGASYYAFGQRFLLHKESKITKREYQYLRKNDWFQVREEDTLPLFSQDIEKQEEIL